VGVAVVVQMLVAMGMLVGMLVLVRVGMGMGNTVVGVLVGMFMGVGMVAATHMIVVNMHSVRSFAVFFYYTKNNASVNEKGEAWPLP